MSLNTRSDYEPAGTYILNRYAELARPLLECAYAALQQGEDVHATLPNASPWALPADADDEANLVFLGKALVAILKAAQDDGVFAALSKAPRCELGVKSMKGLFGWTAYDDRRRENLTLSGG